MSHVFQVSNSQTFVDFCQRWTSPPSASPAKNANTSGRHRAAEHETVTEDEPAGVPEYLSKAAEDISQAMKMEAEEDYESCVDHYR